MKKYKLAIVVTWWGMNCAYSAWALYAFKKKYWNIEPYIVTWTSWWAWPAAYFVSWQEEKNLYVWKHYLSSSKFISFLRFWKIMDVDFLVDEVFKKQNPLNLENIRNSSTKLFISATNINTWKAEYFSNDDDIYSALKASKAIPVWSNTVVNIWDAYYIDWAIWSPVPSDIKKAIDEWADKILVINTSKMDNSIFIKLWEMVLRISTLFMNRNIKNSIRNFLDQKDLLSTESNIFYLRPDNLPTYLMENNKDILIRATQIWYDDLLNNLDLEKFLD